jgi:rod shape-determining protein MreD
VGRYISLPILLVVAILQSTIVPLMRTFGGGPDLVLVLVVSWTLLAGLEEGIVWAMVGGILQDLLTGIPTGTTALTLVIVVFIVNLVVGEIGKGNFVVPPLAIVASTAGYELGLAILLAILGRGVSFGYVITVVAIPTLLLNVLIILPVFRIMAWVFFISRPRRVTL